MLEAIIVTGYIILMIGLGLYFSRRRVHDDTDFLVAGRSLPVLVLTGTLLATFVGSGSVVGGASFVFQHGPGAAIFFFGGTPVAALLVFFLLARRMRSSEATTVPGLIERRFGAGARTLASIIVPLAYVGIVSYQFLGAGKALHLVFGLPDWAGVLVGAALMIGLAGMGGLVSVAYTDYLSAIIVLVSMLIALPIVLSHVGGFSGLFHSLPVAQQSLTGDLTGWQTLSYFLPLFLLILGDQNLFQRFAAARDPGTARRAAFGLVLASVLCSGLITLLVACVRVSHPSIDPSTAMMALAQHDVPGIVGGLLMASIVALLLTTGNSYLLSASASLTQDIVNALPGLSIPTAKGLFANRVAVVLLGLLAWALGAFFPSVLAIQMYAYGIYGAGITPVFVAALIWPRATAGGALAAMIVGAAATLIWEVGLHKPFGWNSILIAAPLAILALVVVSMWQRPPPMRRALNVGG